MPSSRTAAVDTFSEVRRFLASWVTRMEPAYMAVSLPDTFFLSS
jgi:hypothetical protein